MLEASYEYCTAGCETRNDSSSGIMKIMKNAEIVIVMAGEQEECK